MKKYITKPKAEYWIDPPAMDTTITVYEQEDEPTGLLNAKGQMLYRAKAPIGYVRSRDDL